jgi:hypothetical protein
VIGVIDVAALAALAALAEVPTLLPEPMWWAFLACFSLLSLFWGRFGFGFLGAVCGWGFYNYATPFNFLGGSRGTA